MTSNSDKDQTVKRVHPDALDLRPVETLEDHHTERMRQLRNLPEIRTHMYSSHEISREEHRDWLERVKHDDSTKVFGLIHEDTLIGMSSFQNYSEEHQRSSWAFYLDPSVQGRGMGAALEYRMLEMFFETLTGHKLSCEVLETNPAVISLHKKFGFQSEGLLRDHIRKDGSHINVCLLGMTRDDWQSVKPQWQKKFSRL